MSQISATSQELTLFKEKAEKVGFTTDGLYVMLVMLNLDEKTMTIEDMRNVWPYLNEINARKFSYGRTEAKEDRQSAVNGRERNGR